MKNHERTVGLWIAVCATLFFVGLALVLLEQTQVGALALWLLALIGLGLVDHQFTQRQRAERQAHRD